MTPKPPREDTEALISRALSADATAAPPARLRARVLSQVRFEARLASDARSMEWILAAAFAAALLFAGAAGLCLHSLRWSVPGAWGAAQSLWPAMSPSAVPGAASALLALAAGTWGFRRGVRRLLG